MFSAFTKGINIKSYCIAFAAVLVFILASDFIIHGILLSSLYEAIPAVWRSKEVMDSTVWIRLIAQVIMAKYFTFIFVKGYQGRGLGEGVRFGLLMGLFAVSFTLIEYWAFPLSPQILLAWIVGGIIQFVVAGVIAAAVYKK